MFDPDEEDEAYNPFADEDFDRQYRIENEEQQ